MGDMAGYIVRTVACSGCHRTSTTQEALHLIQGVYDIPDGKHSLDDVVRMVLSSGGTWESIEMARCWQCGGQDM